MNFTGPQIQHFPDETFLDTPMGHFAQLHLQNSRLFVFQTNLS